MATITLSLSKKVNQTGKSEIMIRFSANNAQRYRIKSNLFVPVNRWTKKNDISIPKIENDERKNLFDLSVKLNDLKHYLITEYEISDKTQISKAWLSLLVYKFHFHEKYAKKAK